MRRRGQKEGGGLIVDIWRGVMQKKESPGFRIPEADISGLCTTTTANIISIVAVVHLINNKYFSPITSIYLLFSLQHYLLPFHPLTTSDTLHK